MYNNTLQGLTMKYYVYWYHLKDHTNPKTQGYIGITKHLTKRHRTHMTLAKCKSGSTHFINAINKYGEDNLITDILYTVEDKDEARWLEHEYRPNSNIGWNMAAGGVLPIGTNFKPITVYHKDNPSREYLYSSIIEASEALGINYGRLQMAAFRRKPIYGYDGWAVLHEKDFNKALTLDIRDIMALSGKANIGRPSVFKGDTNRWTDEQKAKIGSYHKGKKLPKEQVDALIVHNRANSPKCRSIELKHKDDPTKIYKFHSISEASRQLGLPLSRLKSKAQRTVNTFGNDGWAIHALG